jgi:hypothetical protein
MENTERISALLHEAAETHHVVYRIVDGDDPDWASWYADWLTDLSELPEILGAKPVRSHLVHALVELDRNYTTEAPDRRWEDWYAERLPALVADLIPDKEDVVVNTGTREKKDMREATATIGKVSLVAPPSRVTALDLGRVYPSPDT